MNADMQLEDLISAFKRATQEEVRRGYRDDCRAQVNAVISGLFELLDQRYARKKGRPAK